MLNPQEQRIQKIVDLLEETNLFSADEMEMLEEYLSGQEGKEEAKEKLSKLSLRNLSVLSSATASKFAQLFHELFQKGRAEEAEKLADILFQAGRTSGHALYPFYGYNNESNMFASDPAKKVAIYAVKHASNEWQITQYSINSLKKMSGNDSNVIRKAIDYQYETPAGKLFLYAAFFYTRYPNVKIPEVGKAERKDGFLAGLAKMFDQRKTEKNWAEGIQERDMELLRQYEDIIVNSLDNLFGKKLDQQAKRLLLDAVRNDTVDQGILAMVKRLGPANKYLLRLLGGTAYANFCLSPCLRSVVSICLAAGTDITLNAMDQMDLRGAWSKGGDFDELFGVEPKEFIKWAAGKKNLPVLRAQFSKNKDLFMEYMKNADFETYSLMVSIVKELDPALYEQRKAKDSYRQQVKVVEEFLKTVDASVQNQVRDYLNGETEIDTLYACENDLVCKGYRWGGRHWTILENYEQSYGYDRLTARCEVLLMIGKCFCNYGYIVHSGNIAEKDVQRLFAAVDGEKLALRVQVNGYGDMWDAFYSDKWKNAFCDASKKVFRKYLAERTEEMIEAFQNAGSTGRSFGISILGENPEKYKEAILSFTQDSSKAVKEELLSLLYKRKDWEEDILGLLSSKKAADRETAVRVLVNWDSEKYASILGEALEKEKNGKVKTLLETALKIESSGKTEGNGITQTDLVKELHKGGKKRTLAWAYETPFSKVHKKSGEEAEEEYLQAILLAYSTMSPCGVSPSAATLAAALNEQELAVYVNELFDKWLEAGAESKKRWVLYAASIHGGAEIIRKLQHQIQEWPQAARGAIASEAVQALALNPLPSALLIVDGISRKFKFKQVKAAAGKALEFAASQLGITTEELADRIVPNLGFNENMERIFDYGERKFTVTITTALEIEVFDESGKKLKSLPAPGKRDDEEKAAAAYEEFKQMKKQLKTTVSSQKMRLEMALSTSREWSVEAWKNLFVKNPVMHQFAIGLIWGVYQDHKLETSFRYMEDGSFNTEDEEEFTLPEENTGTQAGGAQNTDEGQSVGQAQFIGLVHPIELSEESLATWKEQLEDYEITQPIEQLQRSVYYRTEEEQDQKSLERFGGCIINDLSLGGKLMAQGWYRGSVQDAGGFYTYYREDPELSLGVELHFSGSYVGGENQDVTVYEARFYNAGGDVVGEDGKVVKAGIKRGSYVYDEANDSNSYCLKEVPERYFSEIVLQLTRALAASKEKNANWKATR